MKLGKSLLIAIKILIIVSCSKEDDTNDSYVNIYENAPNKSDDLIAETYDAVSKHFVYYYGSFDSSGIPRKINCITLNRKNSDTLHHYILDKGKEIAFIYSTLKNGKKLEKIIKFKYDIFSFKVSVHEYNWINKSDVLLKQYTYNTSFDTLGMNYGRIMPAINKDSFELIEVSYFRTSMRDYKLHLGKDVFMSSGGCTIAPEICPSTFDYLIQSSILLSLKLNTLLELKTIKNPDAPISPCNQVIPYTTSSPLNPIGYQLIFGSWKINFITNNCNANKYSEEMNNKTMVFGVSGELKSVLSITDQNNVRGVWFYDEDPYLTFYCDMDNGSGIRHFRFTSERFNDTTKTFIGSFRYVDSISNSIPNTTCTGTLKLTKI